ESLTYHEALDKELAVMDLTALAMCSQRGIPLRVFDFKKPGNIRRVVEGDTSVGTLLSGDEAT
ncbi:MAG: UMP kinase, partial [Planctomycetota bacterium]